MEYELYLRKVEDIMRTTGASREEAAYQLMNNEIKKRYHDITGLWRPTDDDDKIREDSKVFAEKWIKHEITIPANVKIIAYKTSNPYWDKDSENEKLPVLNLVWARG